MHLDNVFKHLADRYPASFASWLLGLGPTELGSVEVLPSELSVEPIRADHVSLWRSRGRILHLEFQTTAASSDPAMPLRMLDYWVRLHRRHGLPVDQVVVLLKPTPSAMPGFFRHDHTLHHFKVVKLWEEDVETLLADPGLLPLATLANTANRRHVLSEVAARLRKIENVERRREISSLAEVVAGLSYSQEVVRFMFNDNLLKESSIYQWIVEEGKAEWTAAGHAEGRHQAAVAMLVAVLSARFGSIGDDLQRQLADTPPAILEQLGGPAATVSSIEAFSQARSEMLSRHGETGDELAGVHPA